MGVKGPSWLSSLKYLDNVLGSMTDYMHTVLLGVCRGLLYLWFDGQHHSEPWYIGDLQQAVDSRLTSIKQPSCITRTPRSISEKKTWKANEFIEPGCYITAYLSCVAYCQTCTSSITCFLYTPYTFFYSLVLVQRMLKVQN